MQGRLLKSWEFCSEVRLHRQHRLRVCGRHCAAVLQWGLAQPLPHHTMCPTPA